jgi:hypothetical protein
MSTILILTEPNDSHADFIEQKLRERNAKFVRFNPAQFPSQAEISLSYCSTDSSTGQTQYILRLDNQTINLKDLKALWYRRPKPPIPHEIITDKAIRQYIAEECHRFEQDVWSLLDCFWLPAPPTTIKRAKFKALQLKIASMLGFELPPTLFTNSPTEFIEFYNQHNGNIISKLASPSFFVDSVSRTFMRYTNMVSNRDVGYASAVSYCPVIFQAYVPKQLELRITVVGQQVFAAEIYSQQTNHTRVDWRHYDSYKTPYFPHQLPEKIESLCVQLVKKLGLCYGAIDMVLTPDGRYVFLEINPNGQYLWVEEVTGLAISDAICDLLISGESVVRPYANV